MIKLNCKNCGKEFWIHNCRKDTARYCSYKCYWERPSKLWKKCLICKKEFKGNSKESKLCSRKCCKKYQQLNPNKGTFKKGQHPSPETEFKKGQKHTSEWKQYMGKLNKGKRNYFWKGGRIKQSGYIYLYSPDHPYRSKKNYVAEHRLVVEKHIKRYLLRKETIHHINEIKTDNRIENLYIFPNIESHSSYHILFKNNLIKRITKSNINPILSLNF